MRHLRVERYAALVVRDEENAPPPIEPRWRAAAVAWVALVVALHLAVRLFGVAVVR